MSRTIETSRLVLRPWENSDLHEIVSIYTDPLVARWLAPQFNATQETPSLRTMLAHWASEPQESANSAGHWAVQKRDSAEVVGGMSLRFEPAGGESLTIEWVLAPDSWGYGFATEAGDALIRWAMHEEDALEVFALVPPDNARAAATAQRIGMEWITELDEHNELDELSRGLYEVYRIRHIDLAYEEE